MMSIQQDKEILLNPNIYILDIGGRCSYQQIIDSDPNDPVKYWNDYYYFDNKDFNNYYVADMFHPYYENVKRFFYIDICNINTLQKLGNLKFDCIYLSNILHYTNFARTKYLYSEIDFINELSKYLNPTGYVWINGSHSVQPDFIFDDIYINKNYIYKNIQTLLKSDTHNLTKYSYKLYF